MPKNIAELLTDAVKYPLAIEAKLPGGAPKVSTMLSDVASKLPKVPDFPMEVPDLPGVPTLPEGPAALKKYVTGVEVTAGAPAPTPAQEKRLGKEILS